jgi:hypothetical protein
LVCRTHRSRKDSTHRHRAVLVWRLHQSFGTGADTTHRRTVTHRHRTIGPAPRTRNPSPPPTPHRPTHPTRPHHPSARLRRACTSRVCPPPSCRPPTTRPPALRSAPPEVSRPTARFGLIAQIARISACTLLAELRSRDDPHSIEPARLMVRKPTTPAMSTAAMVAELVPDDLIADLRSIWRRYNGDADDVVLSLAELTPLLHADLLGPLRYELADPRRVLQDQARRPGSIAYRALTNAPDDAFTFGDYCLLVFAYLMYRENEGPMCPLCDSPLSRLPRWHAFECTCDGLCSRFAEDLRLGTDHVMVHGPGRVVGQRG